MGHGETHHVADGLDVERDAGVLFLPRLVGREGLRQDEATGRNAFQHFPHEAGGAVLLRAPVLPPGARFPVGDVDVLPVLRRGLSVDERAPDLFRSRRDVRHVERRFNAARPAGAPS